MKSDINLFWLVKKMSQDPERNSSSNEASVSAQELSTARNELAEAISHNLACIVIGNEETVSLYLEQNLAELKPITLQVWPEASDHNDDIVHRLLNQIEAHSEQFLASKTLLNSNHPLRDRWADFRRKIASGITPPILAIYQADQLNKQAQKALVSLIRESHMNDRLVCHWLICGLKIPQGLKQTLERERSPQFNLV